MLNPDTLKDMLDVSRNVLTTINRMKQNRKTMSNKQSPTIEQRIAIIADYNAEKIKEIKELIREAACEVAPTLSRQDIKEQSTTRQMWNDTSGIHPENNLCRGRGCEEYNPLDKNHQLK